MLLARAARGARWLRLGPHGTQCQISALSLGAPPDHGVSTSFSDDSLHAGVGPAHPHPHASSLPHARFAMLGLTSSFSGINIIAGSPHTAAYTACTRWQQTAALVSDDDGTQGSTHCRCTQNHIPSTADEQYAHAAMYQPPRPSGSLQRTTEASTSSPTPIKTELMEAYNEALKATDGPIVLYAKRRLAGLYRHDPLQEVTVTLLQQLYEQLAARYVARRHPSGLTVVDNLVGGEASTAPSSGWWSRFTRALHGDTQLAAVQGSGRAPVPRGLYMFGGVGCGKTMLMDVLVESSPRECKLRRMHFHDFMLEVHGRLQRHAHEADPLVAVANDISRKTKVLCLDELFVTDVADAMILHRLFGRLWDNGLVLVATSNRRPDALYEGGLQRQLFLPFIARLKEACVVHDMASPTDYRKLAHHERGLYFVTQDRAELLHARFVELSNNTAIRPAALPVAMGRTLLVPHAGGCIAMFDYADLCEKPLGAADYIALTNSFHTVALGNVPVVTAANRASAYRLVTLVDVLYEHKTRFLVSAETMPHELFANVMSNAEAHDGRVLNEGAVVDDNLAFAKDRTVSRLIEMQSHEYLEAHAQRHAPELLLALQQQAAGGAGSGLGAQT